MSDSNKTYDDILQEELAHKRLARIEAELVHERRKVLAEQEDQRHQWLVLDQAREKAWRDVERPAEIQREYWRRAYLSACEAFLFRGDSAEDARAKAREHADAIAKEVE